MNKIKTVKIRNEDGSISEESYTIAADAINIDMNNNKNVQETIGNINVDRDGNISEQLKKKIDTLYIEDNLTSTSINKALSANQGRILNNNINKRISYYNTIIDLKNSTDIKINDIVYVVSTDSFYEIKENDNSTLDNVFKIAFYNLNYYAYLIFDSSVNFKITEQVPEEDRGYSNINMANYLNIILNRIKNDNANIQEIIFNNGTWLFSPVCVNIGATKRLLIRGIGQTSVFNCSNINKGRTVFAPYSNQTYIIKLGGNQNFENNPTGSRGLSLSDICFSSVVNANDSSIENHLITRGALYIDNNSGGMFSRLDFYKINGICLGIRASFELDFGVVNVRTKSNINYPAIIFDDRTGSNATYDNISSCNFETLRMENIAGDHIYISPLSNFDMNTINYFELECNYPVVMSGEIKNTDYNGTQNIDYDFYIFRGIFRRLVISHMNLSMHSNYYGTYNNQNYRVNGIFCFENSGETYKYNEYEVGELFIKFTNTEETASACKQFLAVKKHNTGNELIMFNSIYIYSAVPVVGSLFQTAEGVRFSRIVINNIENNKDDHRELINMYPAYKFYHGISNGEIVSFDNSIFIEGIGINSPGSRCLRFPFTFNENQNFLIGIYCPSGKYTFTVSTSSGNTVYSDSSSSSARYVEVPITINTTFRDTVDFIISNNTPDIIIDYIAVL